MKEIFYVFCDEYDRRAEFSLHEYTDIYDRVIEPCVAKIGDLFYLHTSKYTIGENWGYLANVLFTVKQFETYKDRYVCRIEAIL